MKRFTSIMVSTHDTFNLTACLLLVIYFTTLAQRCNQTNLLSSSFICDGRNIWLSSSSERVLPHRPVTTPTTTVYTEGGRSDTMTDRGVSLVQIGKCTLQVLVLWLVVLLSICFHSEGSTRLTKSDSQSMWCWANMNKVSVTAQLFLA